MAVPETIQRVAVALVAIPVVAGAAYLGGWALAAMVAAMALIAAGEFYRMCEAKGRHPLSGLGIPAAAALVLLAAVRPELGPGASGETVAVALLLLAATAAAIWARGVEGDPLVAIGTTVFGALYTGALLGYAVYLRHLPEVAGAWHGAALLFVPLLLTWTNDTFAYFVGRAFGAHKLIPSVSPGKTVEGAVGGLLGTIAVAVAYAAWLAGFPTYGMEVGEAIVLGVLISVAAQVGDLVESLLKRDAGVKDSGFLFPGHGGALDRVDSLLFTLPVAYVYLRWAVGAHP